jgi:hypothetical protein
MSHEQTTFTNSERDDVHQEHGAPRRRMSYTIVFSEA